MFGAMLIFVVVVSVVGLVLLLLGYLIRGQGLATLIAGYDPKKVKNPRGLTDWVGSHVMAVGAMTLVYALVPLVPPNHTGLPFHLGFLLFLLVMVVRTVAGARRF